MGQKVNPYGFRLGIVTDWKSRWYADKEYKDLLIEDVRIREYLQKTLHRVGISRIDIERKGTDLRIDIYTARPGIVIGRGGAEVDRLRQAIEKLVGRKPTINIHEVKNPEQDATLLAQSIADQLVGRVNFRRAMKRAVSAALKSPGVQGIRVQCAGRLGGAEMARKEWYREGRVPLHTLRADIDYGFAEAKTKAGQIGVKVWIYKGDVAEAKPSREEEEKIVAEAAMAAGTTTRRTSPRSRIDTVAASSRSLALAEDAESLEDVSGGKRLIVARTRGVAETREEPGLIQASTREHAETGTDAPRGGESLPRSVVDEASGAPGTESGSPDVEASVQAGPGTVTEGKTADTAESSPASGEPESSSLETDELGSESSGSESEV
jgi:small subunit ribosomal protein S3